MSEINKTLNEMRDVMRVKTHQYIAQTAIALLEDIIGISFNHRLVKIGACAPDLAVNRRLKLHNLECAGNEFDKILSKFESGKRSNAFLSYMLGVYSHYVADAFCFAHNNYVVDLKKHMQYEVLFQNSIDHIPLPLDMVDRAMEKSKFLKHKTVVEYIESENEVYMETIENEKDWLKIAETDLIFAITNSITLMLQLVYEVQGQQVLVPAV